MQSMPHNANKVCNAMNQVLPPRHNGVRGVLNAIRTNNRDGFLCSSSRNFPNAGMRDDFFLFKKDTVHHAISVLPNEQT